LLVLVPFYLLAAALVFAVGGSHAERFRGPVEAILKRVPFLGAALHSLAMARAALALEALMGAGVKPIEAWEMAARASGSPALGGIVQAWAPRLLLGLTPGQLVRENPWFPGMFSNLYATGEMSGTLDESLHRLHAFYQEEGTRKLELFARLVPRLIYLLVALYLGLSVLRAYANYFDEIEKIWKG
jgi:type II secretory pathway component PulF